MADVTCPHCGARSSDERLSFSCEKCGGDLAAEAVRPLPRRRGRMPAVIAGAALAAVALFVFARSCLQLAGPEPGRELADRTLGAEVQEPPPTVNVLPGARAAATGGVALSPAGAPAAEHAGVIRGRVVWQRVRPPPVLYFLSPDRDCGVTLQVPLVPMAELGGVPEAIVVAVPEGPSPAAAARAQPLEATLSACRAMPRLLAGPPGTEVVLRTVGAATHELVASADVPGLPATLAPGATVRTAIPSEGTAFVTDPKHPWERIALVALPSALSATVNAEGFFRIAGVPPGPVTLRFWTEATGPFERRLTLAPDGDATVTVDISDELPGLGAPSAAGR
jgi:hypothetical protein